MDRHGSFTARKCDIVILLQYLNCITLAVIYLNQIVVKIFRFTMKTLDEIETTLKGQMPFLQEQFKVKKMGILGSFVRGEQNEAEDIDILVQFSEPIGAIKYLNLENYLSNLLEMEVNLVLKMGLSYRIAQQVLKEALFI